MTSQQPPAQVLDKPPRGFSLMLGGPLYRTWLRLRLTDDHLRTLPRRIVVSVLFLWLPLFVAAGLEGNLHQGPTVPFLLDVETHMRFLITTPLLLGAELVVHVGLLPMLQQFWERDLLPAEHCQEVEEALESALRWRNSISAELTLLACAYVLGHLFVWPRFMKLGAFTWYAHPSAAGEELSWAGAWYLFVSLPLFQFLLLRWWYRLFLWAQLLRRIARVPLHLVATHPDGVGGLGFLSDTAAVLAPLCLAHGTLLAGAVAGRILWFHAKLSDFRAEMSIITGFTLLLVLGPLLVFVPQLIGVRRSGRIEYGALAQAYVRAFHTKWLSRGADGQELLGSADIQSLADLNNTLGVVQTMRLAPITRSALAQLVVVTLAPCFPLLLTLMPLDELVKKLLGILF